MFKQVVTQIKSDELMLVSCQLELSRLLVLLANWILTFSICVLKVKNKKGKSLATCPFFICPNTTFYYLNVFTISLK
jgi:hypothetical protein